LFSAEAYAYPLSEGRGTDANVHRHVEYLTLQDEDKLALSIRVLEVEPAQHAPDRMGEVVLNEPIRQAGPL
jgi:hypothetical protein